MGCFWGAEKRMSAIPGVVDVESGYANGDIEGSYEAILHHERLLQRGLSAKRNHAEVIKVSFDPAHVSLETVLATFWESHDPTQGNQQGNDVGSNYRSAIYTANETQRAAALKTRDHYQQALTEAGFGTITTEIAPLTSYHRAEEYHQDYLEKNPHGYCGLGGTHVAYPINLPPNADRQLIVFTAENCGACRQFKTDILDHWQTEIPVTQIQEPKVPEGWALQQPIAASPTTLLFEKGREISRFTGYSGNPQRFWQWLGSRLLSPAQQRIAFEQGTEPPYTGAHLDEKRPGRFVDPITGDTLFRSETKFESGCGWPSFFKPIDGALTTHEDDSHGMRRIEVRSTRSGIHLGHVFDDGPPPTGERYCINGNVLKFVPDEE